MIKVYHHFTTDNLPSQKPIKGSPRLPYMFDFTTTESISGVPPLHYLEFTIAKVKKWLTTTSFHYPNTKQLTGVNAGAHHILLEGQMKRNCKADNEEKFSFG